jgi:hypothetical protein
MSLSALVHFQLLRTGPVRAPTPRDRAIIAAILRARREARS